MDGNPEKIEGRLSLELHIQELKDAEGFYKEGKGSAGGPSGKLLAK